jgi:hypothetical protein
LNDPKNLPMALRRSNMSIGVIMGAVSHVSPPCLNFIFRGLLRHHNGKEYFRLDRADSAHAVREAN